MIPLIELHDATGVWSGLARLIDFWTRPDVLSVLRAHEQYLLLNIGNEVGDENVTHADYRAGYTEAVRRLRAAGISVPLVIDAADWGHQFEYIANNALALIDADPLHNILFSLHVWWDYHGASAGSDFRKVVEEVVVRQIPFVVGEFSGVGELCDSPSPFSEIVDACNEGEIGWIAWEWGPGNEFGDNPCPAMNMTGEKDEDPRNNGLFANLTPGWARQVALDHPHSIQNTAVTPRSLLGGCG
jgi:mannan endo-1,4-beta-mannosidase